MTPSGPESLARQKIDAQLEAAGWVVQSREELNLGAARGVAAREIRLEPGFGIADYLLFLDRKAVGAFEAKKAGTGASGVEGQARKYSDGLPATLRAPLRPLPFVYIGTGEETSFVNRLDPDPRTRKVFAVHHPETMAEWLSAPTLARWIRPEVYGEVGEFAKLDLDDTRPSSLRGRLRFTMPPVDRRDLWANQVEAIEKLEKSLRADRPPLGRPARMESSTPSTPYAAGSFLFRTGAPFSCATL